MCELFGIVLAVHVAVNTLPMKKKDADDNGDDQHHVSQACPLFSRKRSSPNTHIIKEHTPETEI